MSRQCLTPRQYKRMYVLLRQGFNKAEIARALEVKYSTVHHRLRHDAMTPEQKQARRGQYNTWSRNRKTDRNFAEQPIFRPTPEMIHDRDVRAMLPHRDLTGAFFGDPPVGLSALEGRGA